MKRLVACTLTALLLLGIAPAANASSAAESVAAAPGLCDVFPHFPGC